MHEILSYQHNPSSSHWLPSLGMSLQDLERIHSLLVRTRTLLYALNDLIL